MLLPVPGIPRGAGRNPSLAGSRPGFIHADSDPALTRLARTKAPSNVRVIYIAAWGRSGTTPVGQLLGSRPNSVFVGELRFLWQRGLIEGRLCSCGRPVSTC